MSAMKVAIASVLPALIVAARFAIPGLMGSKDDLTWFFAVAGLLATLVGCLGAALPLRRRIAHIPFVAVVAVAIGVAAALLAIFPTMPQWPFTGEGFIVAWVLMSAGFTAVLMYAISYRYA
jgi:hypothetical protein